MVLTVVQLVSPSPSCCSQAGKMVALCCSLITFLEFTIWDEIPPLFVSFIRLHLKSSLSWKLDGKIAVKSFPFYCSATWFWKDQVEKEEFLSTLLSSWLEVTVSVWVQWMWNGTQYDMRCTFCNLGYLEDYELWNCQCKAQPVVCFWGDFVFVGLLHIQRKWKCCSPC